MKWTTNKVVLSTLTIILLLGMGMGIAYSWMDGENPIQLGVTLWYLNDIESEGIKIAADSDRYLVKLNPEQIAQYLPKISNTLRGEWVLKAANDSVLIYEDTNSEEGRSVEVGIKPFLNQYLIIRVLKTSD